MTSHRNETDRILDRFLEELGEPLPSVRVRRANNRVLENLSGFDTVLDPAPGIGALPFTPPKRRWAPVAAVAAALLAAAVLVGTLSLPSSAQPIAKRINGKFIAPGDRVSIAEGKLVQTEEDGGEVLELRDGSRVEMSADVKLSINRATDGLQVDLNEGNIIVTAAKQHDGHLYVKTKDCVVSVVGTVFSVKAEATGSRVAVIEGEVHVQHGDVSQTLLPGQQVATNTEMKAVPIQSEIGWSQDAAVHTAMLQQSTVPAAPEAPAPVGNTLSNPDLIGEIKLILAPVDQGLMRQLTLPSFNNWATPPNGFSFAIIGLQGRTISFNNSKGETFSYGCTDCSFVVSENGVSKAVTAAEPGVEFKLSADGSTLTATCHAAPCSMGRWITDLSWTKNGGAPNAWGASVAYTISRTNPANPQTFTIATSQLVQQQGGSVLFVVTKPAGQ
jgi:hypothetical protein